MKNFFIDIALLKTGNLRKVFLAMKLTAFLLLFACLQVSAHVDAQTITYTGRNVSLEKVFREIRKQTGYEFLYNSTMLEDAPKVELRFDDTPVKVALNDIFKDRPFTYDIIGKTIVIRNKKKTPASAPVPAPGEVHGTVTDSATGNPLAGVTVQVKGSTIGAVTDRDGSFSLEAPEGAVLEVSYLGYASKKVALSGENNIKIELSAITTGLNQLVVVGYGTQKREDLTGAISVINSDAIENVPSSNLFESMQGEASGVDITNDNGGSHPGAEPVIRIRGARSLNASNNPLIVVDGIPYEGSVNNINPDDIASISVLKDASATAIYGSRAANGVLLVTTKKGKIGKPKVAYSAYAGFKRVYKDFPMMNAAQFTLFKKWARFNSFPGRYTGLDDPDLLTDGFFDPQELKGIEIRRNTDWQKLVYKNGFVTNHHLSVYGGSENTQYYVSGGYYKETGIYPGQAFERYSIEANVSQQLGKHVELGLSSLNNFSVTNGESFNPIDQAVRASPMASPYDSLGNLLIGPVPGSNTQAWNPLNNFLPNAEVEKQKELATFNSLYIKVNLFKGLSYRLNAGANIRSNIYGNYFASNTSANRGSLPTAENKSKLSTDYTVENLIIYNRDFGRSTINFTGLYSIQQSEAESNGFDYSGLPADILQYYEPQYGSNLEGSGSYAKKDLISYMGRLNYSYANKYLATLTIREDGSSVLAPGNKYHVFPSAALAWNLINEPFIKHIPSVNDLKLRVSYGMVGNSSIDPYQTLGLLESTVYNFGSVTNIGVRPKTAPDPNLGWEYTATLNIGVDFGLFQNRIRGSIEAYHQYTHSLILGESLPPTSGIPSSTLVNVGKTENKGIELTLSTVNLKGDGINTLRWTTGLNIYLNRGKIVKLSNGIKENKDEGWFVGHPIQVYYDYKRIGIWQNTAKDSAEAAALGLTTKGTGSVIGNIRVADINHDGKINSEDEIILGTHEPKWEGGMTNSISFKGFDFTAVMFARVGGMMWSELYGDSYLNTFQGYYNNLNVNYWTPSNHENYFPKPNEANTKAPDHDVLGYFNDTFLKIRSLSLGYHIPKNLLLSWKITGLYVYATAKAPFYLFSPYVNKFNGLSPETDRDMDVDTPANWSMVFGLKLKF